MRSYWEKMVYVVKGQVSDNPVYVVYPENGDSRKTRTLHRNLLILVTDLPVEAPTAARQQTRVERQKQAMVQINYRENDGVGDITDSDEEGNGGGYWLRIPASWTESENAQLPGRAPVRVSTQTQGREYPSQILDKRGQGTPEGGDTHHLPPCPDDTNERGGVEDESELEDLSIRTENPMWEIETGVRRSTRERRPKQIYTYDALGQPLTQPYSTISTLTAYLTTHIPVWGVPSCTTPITYSNFYMPQTHSPSEFIAPVYGTCIGIGSEVSEF